MADKDFKVKQGLDLGIPLSISEGGTGQTSSTNAINALLPVQTGENGKFLTTDGTNTYWAIDNSGVSLSGGSTITADSAATKGLVIQGAASQTANLQEWQDSAGTVVARVSNLGGIFSNNNISQSSSGRTFLGGIGDYNAFLNVSIPTASRQGIVIRGNASQTANLQEWQNSAGSIRLAVSSYGTLNSYTEAIFNNTLNGTGTALLVKTNNAGGKPLVVQGAASQTVDLQQWQDSSTNSIAKVDSSGNIFTATRFATTSATPNIFGIVYGSGNSNTYAEGSMSTNAGFSSPSVFPNEEGWYPYFAYQVPDIVETSDDGITWTNQAPMAYAPLFAFQPSHFNTVSNRFLRITMNQPTFTFIGLAIIRFRTGTNSRLYTMKTELLNSSGGNVSTFGPTAGTGAFDGSILAQKFNSYNGTTTATRITIENTNFVAGDSFDIASLMTYVSKPGTGRSFQTKFPMSWNSFKSTTFQPTQPGAVPIVIKGRNLSSTITNAVGDGTTVTFTTSANNSFVAGNTVNISGINPSSYNLGSVTIASVPTGNTFTVSNAATDTYVSGGTATIGQGVDLQQWQNSGGTALMKVASDGHLIVGATDTGGSVSINPDGVNRIPLRIRLAASQIADSIRIDNSSGVNIFRISSAGAILAPSAATTALVVKAEPSQTADLQQWQNSTGAILASVSPVGTIRSSIFASTTTSLTYIATNFDTSGIGIVVSSAAQKGLIVRGAASQTADLQQWQNSAGTVLAYIDKDGQILTPRVNLPANGLIVEGGTGPYIQMGSSATYLYTRSASNKGLVIQGATSQTADLQQWQNSAGTVLAEITANGGLELNGKDIELITIAGAL